VARFRESYALPPPEDGRESVPPQVLVLGAGNTAMDVARTARRLGLQAVCVDWVDERFALARPDELAEARHEGVEVRFLRTLARLEGEEGRVRRAALTRTRQNRADRRPKPGRGDPEMLDVDLVVMAMGYRSDPAYRAVLPGTPVAREAGGIPDRRWLASGVLANPAPEFASLVADRLRGTGAVVRAIPLAQVSLADLTETDLLIVGTWVEGLVVARVGAARAARAWLAGLPRLPGLRAATFCTFAISPGGTLAEMRRALEGRGAVVMAEGAFGPGARNITGNAASFAGELLAAAWHGHNGQLVR
jgi:NADPH-dependent glutamate synthase beta subunit-like oxidoreductase